MTEDLASPTEPIWLLWAREIQALAQTGLAFTRDQYDRERYQQLHAVAAQIIAKHTGLDVRDIDMLFSQQAGYATPKLGVRGYPVIERHRYIWIWMGEKDKADPAKIPDFSYNDDPNWAAVGANLHVEANYLLLVENLIDLSHVAFVHSSTIGSTEDTNAKLKLERGDDFVRVIRDAPGISCPPSMQSLGFAPVVDQTKIITFTPASNIWIDIPTRDAAPVEGRNEPMQRRVMILNAITPETETSCHYFWVNARDFDQENKARSEFFLKTVTTAFNEDKDMLEAQQRVISLDPTTPTVNVNADWGGVQATRMMAELIASEAGAS